MKKILFLSALLALSASADPLLPELWKTEYPKHLQAIKTPPKIAYRGNFPKGVPEVLDFVTSHAGEWDIQPELDKLVELALPRLEKGGDIRTGRRAAGLLYDSPTASIQSKLMAARYLALGLIDARGDYDGAEKLYMPLWEICKTNGNARALADVAAADAHIWVLKGDREEAIRILERERNTPGSDRFKAELDKCLDIKISEVYTDFYDYRGALDFNLKRGNKRAAFNYIRENRVDDRALGLKLARELIVEDQDMGRHEAWTWAWEYDEKFCRDHLDLILGKTVGKTNLVVNALSAMIESDWPRFMPHPTYQHNWTKTLSTWSALEGVLKSSGRTPGAKVAKYVAVASVSLGDSAQGLAAIDFALTNEKLKPEERYELEMIKTVCALKGTEVEAEAEIAKADRELAKDCPAKARTAAFEHAASFAVMLGNDPVARGVAHYYKTHYNALPEKRVYPVRFSEKPVPGIAAFDELAVDPFLGLFGFAVPESAFTRSYGGSTEFFETDVTTGARNVGEGGESRISMRVVADAWGIHILQTLRTPDARKIEAGEANGGSYECYIGTPGEPHHIFMCYPAHGKGASISDLNYDKPGFRRFDDDDPDSFRSEVRFSDDRVENYVGISWNSFADVLPENGTIWDFESLYWGSPSCAWNGTESIHGRSTFGQFRFELDDAARLAILRQRLYAAARNYAAEKSGQGKGMRAGLFDTWADPVIGDPAFYAKCLKPVCDELDPVAAKIKSGMSDEEIEEIAAKYLTRFHNLRFEIAALREKYLTDDLLPDPSPSDRFLDDARRLYKTPEYQASMDSIVTNYAGSEVLHDDWPTPGGKIGWVKVDGMRNFRDIGGWNGLKTGRVYRATEADCKISSDPGNGYTGHYAIQSEGMKVIRQLGIKTDLDLRKHWECPDPDRSPLGIALVRAPGRPYGELFAKVNKKAWTDAIRLFADSRNYPIYFHCWGGADRTGTLAMLLQGLCGVDEVDIDIDYELTSFAGRPRTRDPKGPASKGWIDMIARIKKKHPAATFKESVALFLKSEFGITDVEIAAIRSNLMDEKPKCAVPEVLLEVKKSDANPRNSEGDLIKTKDGRILFVYTHFYKDPKSAHPEGRHDDASAEIALTESKDGGKTWSPFKSIVRKDDKMLNVMSVSLLRLGDGRLAAFYIAKFSRHDSRIMMITSSDEGKTWSKPQNCIADKDKGLYVLNNARAYRIGKTGRILLPLACHSLGEEDFKANAAMVCAISDDDGKTWRLSADRHRGPVVSSAAQGSASKGSAPKGPAAALKGSAVKGPAVEVQLQEPGLIELKDGRLMMYARSSERRQWRLFSTDGGDHWTLPEPITEYSTTTVTPATYARLADGRLVVVFCDGSVHAEKPILYERRWPFTIGVSTDEGKTWKTKLIERDDQDSPISTCYTAVREIDGKLFLAYCYRDWLATSRVTAIPLEWLP